MKQKYRGPNKKKLSSPKLLIVYVTFPNRSMATRITQILLQKRLIACANIFSKMESHYFWQSKIQKNTEVPAIYKTTEKNWHALEKAILVLHPYDCPCIIGTKMDKITARYADWLLESTKR